MIILYKIERAISIVYSTLSNKISMLLSQVTCGANFRCCGTILFRNYKGKEGIIIGNNVCINSGMKASPFNGAGKTRLIVGTNGQIVLHDNVSLSNVGIYSATKIEIGEGTNIGGGSRICDTDFHSSNPEYRLNGNTHVPTKPVFIGKRVFIGGHALILKGVTIGDEAVIGGNSVVTKDIPAGEIWAGNPAKFIKKVK